MHKVGGDWDSNVQPVKKCTNDHIAIPLKQSMASLSGGYYIEAYVFTFSAGYQTCIICPLVN